jgi:pteridine reductase
MIENSLNNKVVLVTGAARRIGAAIVTRLQQNGARVAIHYRGSSGEAEKLATELNDGRPGSAKTFQADLLDNEAIAALIRAVVGWGGRLDGLVNNASTFYPTPIGEISAEAWDDLVGSNFKAPLFLSQEAVPHLVESSGSIINIVDIHSQRPLPNHLVYGPAKAALAMLTRSLAKDLAPEIRVNGVSAAVNSSADTIGTRGQPGRHCRLRAIPDARRDLRNGPDYLRRRRPVHRLVNVAHQP